jgi:hypothetical protein
MWPFGTNIRKHQTSHMLFIPKFRHEEKVCWQYFPLSYLQLIDSCMVSRWDYINIWLFCVLTSLLRSDIVNGNGRAPGMDGELSEMSHLPVSIPLRSLPLATSLRCVLPLMRERPLENTVSVFKQRNEPSPVQPAGNTTTPVSVCSLHRTRRILMPACCLLRAACLPSSC